MSAFLYGRFEARREASDSGKSKDTQPPGLKTYADALVGLVPAEVIAASTVFVAAFTDTEEDTTTGDEAVAVTVTDASNLELSFYGLFLLAAGLYVFGHLIKTGAQRRPWGGLDFVRMLIPPLAFVGWTMALQPSTMFDAAISISEGMKVLLVVFGGTVLGAAAIWLGMVADKEDGGG
jgi:hypothetical protein